MQPAPKLDVDRAVTTIEMLLSGGKPAGLDDLAQALAVVGPTVDAIFDALVRNGRADIAWSFVAQIVRDLPPPERAKTTVP